MAEAIRHKINTKMLKDKKTGKDFMPFLMDLNLITKLMVPSPSGNYEDQGWTTIEIGPNDIKPEELKDSFIKTLVQEYTNMRSIFQVTDGE